MKNATFFFLLILSSLTSFGQTAESTPPNKTVVRLIILNKNGDILMKESSLGWVTIASFYTQRQSFNEVIDSLTNTYGIKISKPRLGGIFTYKYNFKKSADTRLLYVATYLDGEIKQGKNDYYFTWLPKEEAIKRMKNTVPSLGQMTQQILDAPNELWGGSFYISRDAKGKLNSRITEDFYSLEGGMSQKEQLQYASVKETLGRYMDGSSYSKRNLIESAFSQNASLYLTNREGLFKEFTPKEYANFFNNGEPGKFNGRIAEIISVEVIKDIARAKVKISFPERNMVYIDLFLLKKLENNWKIISKTATRVDNPPKNAVLFIVSNAHFYGNTKLTTGNSFSEIVHAYDVFKEAGYIIDFVSPEGGSVPLSYIDTSDKMIKKHLYDTDFMNALKHTKSPSEINASKYKAVQYIGGGGAMFGVPENKEIQQIAMEVYEKHNGIISSVCHGTAGIVNLKTKDGKYLVAGKKVSGYPDDFENKDTAYFKTFPFLIKETIQKRGGKFFFSDRGKAHVEVDGRLVTGQNFLSSKQVSLKIIELINAAKK